MCPSPPITKPADKATTPATIGISKYASTSLGELVFVELPTIPLTVSAGDSIGAVESVKTASDLYAPVSGEVVETNSALEDSPTLLNDDPECEAGDEGWILKIKLSEEGKQELQGTGEDAPLMDAAAYKKFTESEA